MPRIVLIEAAVCRGPPSTLKASPVASGAGGSEPQPASPTTTSGRSTALIGGHSSGGTATTSKAFAGSDLSSLIKEFGHAALSSPWK